MYERLIEFDLINDIMTHDGIVIGYSAGAMIQLFEYHITPDLDYPVFTYNKGLGLINDFGIEVHYTHTEIQKASIERFIVEKLKPVYAIGDNGALIIVGNSIQMLGDVTYFPAK